LLASRDELEEIAALTSPRSADPDDGAKSEPEPDQVIEPAGARLERRGGKIKDFWPKVLGHAAAWIAEEGQADNQAVLERFITEKLEALGNAAEPSTVRRYAAGMLEGFNEQLADH
jgi:hypothetical protein